MTNHLTDMISMTLSILAHAPRIRVSKFEYVVWTHRFDVDTLLSHLCNIIYLISLSSIEFNLTHMNI